MAGAGRSTFDGITVPVLDMELAELESSSSSINGSGGGREDTFVFAKDLARSDMVRAVSCKSIRYHATCNSVSVQGSMHEAAQFGFRDSDVCRGDSICGACKLIDCREQLPARLLPDHDACLIPRRQTPKCCVAL